MQEIRWIQRFENFKKAIQNLQETVDCINQNGINKIYQMALVQAFEIAFELSWKTLKDYLEFNGINATTPREVIKEAFAANIIIDGQTWIEMMEARNKTSHTYNEEYANQLVNEILNTYLKILLEMQTKLKGKING